MAYDPKNSSLVEVEYVTPAYGARHVTGLYDGTTLEEINPKGVLVAPGTLIEWTYTPPPPPPTLFCTPLYSNLPVSYPPYECGTEVNTAGVTNFDNAWAYCSEITEFPCIDTSSGTSFRYTWYYANSLTGTFPLLDFSNAQDFAYTWCCWDQSGAPLEFAPGCFDACTKNELLFNYSFYGHYLSEESFDNIITSIDASGSKCGNFWMWDQNAYPSQETIDGPLYNLVLKGWDVALYLQGVGDLFPGPNYECSTEVETAGIENFNSAWAFCNGLTSFPLLDVSDGKLFYGTWQNCSGLTSFPELDVSSGTNFSYAWFFCTSLTSFPALDVSNCVSFNGTWSGCTGLTSFPALDVSNCLSFNGTWSGCTSLTSFPALDVSNGTNYGGAWANCSGLTSFPELDVSNGVNFYAAWGGCNGLTSFPALDVSNGVNFYGAWSLCSGLTSFPALDVSNGVNFYGAWSYCSGLTSFPALDVSNGTQFSGTWANCSGLTSFPELDVSSGTNFSYAWSDCTSLTSFPELNVSNGVNFNGTWAGCTSLTSFPANMFDNCAATVFSYAWYICALDEESVDNILVSLDTAGQSNGTVNISGGTSSAPGTAGAAAKASLIAKGWTVTTN